MPFAVTHVLTSIVLVDLYRDYVTRHKKLFTIHTVFLAGLFGLLPDIDYVLGMAASAINLNLPFLFQHGGVTHTPFFALLNVILTDGGLNGIRPILSVALPGIASDWTASTRYVALYICLVTLVTL